MALLEAGQVVEDPWIQVPDDAEIPAEGSTIISVARFRAEEGRLAGRNAPLGVLLPPDTDPRSISDILGRLALVAIDFPVFKDGRGFTIARRLRERFNFKGEIRAVGHVLPDQYAFLLRCGFDRVAIPEGQNPVRWAEALSQISISYQPGLAPEAPLSLLRHRLR